jgi:hypothetical protein
MDYEQKYKDALGWMRSVYPTMTGADKEDAEHFFPELKESEDEKTRKALIAFISDAKQSIEIQERDSDKWQIEQLKGFLSWLEKQGEQKRFLSKDDEYTLARIIERLEDDGCPSEWIDLLHDIYAMPYQKSAEWNEEDKNMAHLIGNAITTGESIKYLEGKNIELINAHAWLDSLAYRVQPQNHWKPSKDQMTALRRMKAAVAGEGVVYNGLNSLYDDLVKLVGTGQ